jgi:hypothetical protein
MAQFDSRAMRLLIAFLSFAVFCFAVDKKQLTDAVAAVDANLKTTAGKQYDEEIGKEFPARYRPSLQQCKQSNPATSTDPFDMFLKLSGEGRVQEALVYPETGFAVCARDALLHGQFGAPPHTDYWVNIHLQLKR